MHTLDEYALKSTYLMFHTRFFLFLTKNCHVPMCTVSSHDRGLTLHKLLNNLMLILSISAHLQDIPKGT